MDVHRYLLIELDGRDVVIDVTFPEGDRWDGQTSMAVSGDLRTYRPLRASRRPINNPSNCPRS